MKFGFRIPSLKRRIAARTSLKRIVRHSLGLKAPRGMGIITNPKRALYNKVYNKTTISIDRLFNSTKKVTTETPFPKPNSNKREQIGGEIGYHGLIDWWLTTFTKEEREHIENVFRPLGGDSNSLTEGHIDYSSQNAAGLLHTLAGWFNKPGDREIARKIVQKAEELAQKGTDVLDLHFTLQQEIEIYYRDRDTDPTALDKAIKACKEQIKIAPKAAQAFLKEYPNQSLPAHVGYSQLAIILKKQGEYKKVIELCEQAKNQDWAGDWDRRIEEAKKKLLKQ